MKGRGHSPVRHRRAAARGASRGRGRDCAAWSSPGASSSGRRWKPSSASSPSTSGCSTWSASRTAPTRSRSRSAAWASGPATTWSCLRSPSTRAPRRFPTPARGPCSATSIRRRSASPPRRWSAALTPHTRAVIAVDLFGRMAPVDALRERLAGARDRGARGRGTGRGRAPAREARGIARRTSRTFSFFPSKNLFCFGDGGAIVTDDPAVAERARLLRFHGSRDKSSFEAVGWNSRLDAIQAAVLRTVLTRLDGWNERRRELAAAYADAGPRRTSWRCPRPADGEEPVHHLFVTARGASPTQLARAARRRRHRSRAPITGCRSTASPRWQPGPPASDLPGTEQAARHEPRPADGPDARSGDGHGGRGRPGGSPPLAQTALQTGRSCGLGSAHGTPLSARKLRQMRKAVNDPVYRHRLFQLLVDAGLVALAYWLAYALRFDHGIPRALQRPAVEDDRVRRRSARC